MQFGIRMKILKVEVKVEKDNEDEIIFSVKDHGYGIEDQYLDKVFYTIFQNSRNKS